MNINQQTDFSSILFDTLFSLVIFFSIDSFLKIQNPLHFVFYLVCNITLIHWWLIFKSADDMFDKEVTNSALDLIFGIIQVVLLNYLVLTSNTFDVVKTGWFLITVLIVDLFWTFIWRYIGTWKTDDVKKIKLMETELENNLKVVFVGLTLFISLNVFSSLMSIASYVASFIGMYFVYIVLTFRYKIIDIKIF